jgi:hypothetical protein
MTGRFQIPPSIQPVGAPAAPAAPHSVPAPVRATTGMTGRFQIPAAMRPIGAPPASESPAAPSAPATPAAAAPHPIPAPVKATTGMTGRFQIPAAIRPVGAPATPAATPPAADPAAGGAPRPMARLVSPTVKMTAADIAKAAAPARAPTTTVPVQAPKPPATAAPAASPVAAPVKSPAVTTSRIPVQGGARPAAPAQPGAADRFVEVPSGLVPAVGEKPDSVAPDSYNVFLSQISSEEKREDAAKLLVEIRKCTIDEARELVTRSMIPVSKDVSKSDAEVVLHRFRMIKVAGRMTLAKKTS